MVLNEKLGGRESERSRKSDCYNCNFFSVVICWNVAS